MTTAYFSLASGNLVQDWSNAGLITANDDWSGVPSITGFLGDGLTTATDVDPRTYTAANQLNTTVDVNANQTNPLTFNTGGVTEFALANPTIALTGSGTADAPSIVCYVDATGRTDVRFQCTIRDLENGGDNAAQQVAVQYRIGAGNWTNIAYFADVTAGPNVAGSDTLVDVTLGADANNAAQVEIRVVTTNAGGNDEFIGIDDIVISSQGGGGGDVTPPTLTATSPADNATGAAAGANIVLTFSETVAAGAGSFTISNGAGDTRSIAVTDGQVSISGNTVTINPVADLLAGSTYAVTAEAGIVEDAAGNDFDGLQAGELDFTVANPVAVREIGEIQGLGHTSPFVGQQVRTVGVVTAVDINGGRGFYIQSQGAGDGDSRTSDGLFVFTNAAPTVVVGDLVQVDGTVSEFLSGSSPSNASFLTATQLITPTINVLGTAAIVPVVLGGAGLQPPTEIIDNDSFATYDPAQDGIDFYESLEGQLVTITAPTVVGFVRNFTEAFVVLDRGVNATGFNSQSGITVSEGDFNPERLQLDNDTGLNGGVDPFTAALSQGDQLATINAVVGYNFGNYEFNVLAPVVIQTDVTIQREETTLTPAADALTVASYNLLNVDALDPAAKFTQLAQDIVDGLGAPIILALQEVQDNNGEASGGTLSAQATADRLIAAIVAEGGPTYTYVEVAPATENSSGGAPGGNIRNGYLYNDALVDLVAGSVEAVDPTNPAFNNSRKPLAAEFVFNGETYTLVNVHSSSRTGSDPLFGDVQPPVNAAEDSRIAQATVIRDYVDDVLATDADARIIVLGDFNGFLFETPFDILTAGGTLTNLQTLLPVAERFTFQFDGNDQAIDHMLVTSNLLTGAQFDIVHRNADRFGLPANGDSGSDHDPIVAAFTPAPPPPPVELNGTSRNDTIVGGDGNEIIRGFAGADKLFGRGGDDVIEGGDGADIIQGGAGTNTLSGGAFSDRFAGEAVQGVHIIDGGLGVDTFEINSAGDTVTVDLLAGTSTGGYASGSTLTSVENARIIEGVEASVVLRGSDGANALTGGILDDVLDGRAGADRIIGGAGADTLTGGTGNDRFIFRPGEVEGDIITDFDGRGTLFGDSLQFMGFGPDAVLTNDGNVFSISYDGIIETFTMNVTSLATGDFIIG